MSTRTRPYETLIRHYRTVVDGKDVDTIAAHHVRIKEYIDDEEDPPQVVSARVLDPQPINAAGLEGVLGQALVTATAQAALAVQGHQAAVAALQEAQNQVRIMEGQALRASEVESALRLDVVRAEARSHEAEQQISALHARVAELEQQLAVATAPPPPTSGGHPTIPEPEPVPAPGPVPTPDT